MPQNLETICAHNAPGQVSIPGEKTPCRKCGCLLEPEARGVNSSNQVAPQGVLAEYPGER